MPDLYFDDKNKYLKLKDIQEGKVYCLKDGRLAMYCGVSVNGQYIFYFLMEILTCTSEDKRHRVLAHARLAHQYIVDMCKKLLQMPLDVMCLGSYANLPKLLKEYPDLDFSAEWYSWYTRNACFGDGGIPIIKEVGKKDINSARGYVKTADLQSGRFYRTGQASSVYYDLYMYIGRCPYDGDFLWLFIGNRKLLGQPLDSNRWFVDITRTKSNKKVRLAEEYSNLRYSMQELHKVFGEFIESKK